MVREKRISAIRLYRLAAGKRLDEIADRIGKSKMYVSRLERGERGVRVTPEIAEEIANLLEVPKEKLFEEE